MIARTKLNLRGLGSDQPQTNLQQAATYRAELAKLNAENAQHMIVLGNGGLDPRIATALQETVSQNRARMSQLINWIAELERVTVTTSANQNVPTPGLSTATTFTPEQRKARAKEEFANMKVALVRYKAMAKDQSLSEAERAEAGRLAVFIQANIAEYAKAAGETWTEDNAKDPAGDSNLFIFAAIGIGAFLLLKGGK